MRVLLVAGAVFPEQLALWRACRRSDVDLRILGSSYRAPVTALTSVPGRPSDIPTMLVRPLRPLRSKGQLWWMYSELLAAIDRMQPDIVHVLNEPWGILSLQSLLVANSRGRPTPVCAHAADNIFSHGRQLEQLIRRRILAAALPRLAGFAGWTNEVIDRAHQFGLPGSTPTVVVPGEVPEPERFTLVSDSVRREARQRLGLPSGSRVVGFVGRLAAEKGVLDAIAAVRDLPGVNRTVLCIWGSGPLESQVRAIQRHEGEKVLYLGPLTLKDVPIALHACDVVVIPSKTSSGWKEQFGRVALEAMLSGCAIVAYRSGALPYVLGDAATLVDEGDLAGLSSALKLLLEDDSERSELGKRARQNAVLRFDPHVLANRMIDFWDRVRSS